jgi:DNA adenine methylase
MFRYPGGKSKLKNRIVSIIKSYYENNDLCTTTRYVEPFFGGGAIGRSLFSSVKKIAINDYDIGVAMFWDSIINSPESLCNLIKDFKPSVDKFHEFKDFFIDKNSRERIIDRKGYSSVEIGFMKMALHQMSFSGLGVMSGGPLGGEKQDSKYKIDCRWNSYNMVVKIIKYHNLLNKNFVYKGTCCYDDFYVFLNNIIEREKNIFMYLDPPYYTQGKDLYQFYFKEEDHQRLSKFLREVDQPWILSYDYSEEIRDLYSWAFLTEVDVYCTINTRNGSLIKKEFLITDKNKKYLLT